MFDTSLCDFDDFVSMKIDNCEKKVRPVKIFIENHHANIVYNVDETAKHLTAPQRQLVLVNPVYREMCAVSSATALRIL